MSNEFEKNSMSSVGGEKINYSGVALSVSLIVIVVMSVFLFGSKDTQKDSALAEPQESPESELSNQPPYFISNDLTDVNNEKIVAEDGEVSMGIPSGDLTAAIGTTAFDRKYHAPNRPYAIPTFTTFETKGTIHSNPIYIDAPVYFTGAITTPQDKYAPKTPGANQGESGYQHKIYMVSGPRNPMVIQNGSLGFNIFFTAPGTYKMRHDVTVSRTFAEVWKEPMYYMGSNNTYPVYSQNHDVPAETVSRDYDFVVLADSVSTNPAATTNKNITVDAGRDSAGKVNSWVGLGFYGEGYKFVSAKCVGAKPGYCTESGVTEWTKVSGPGDVIFDGGAYRCTSGQNSGDVGGCKSRKMSTSYYPAPNPHRVKFSAAGTYVLRLAVFDQKYGYAYDDRTVVVK